MDDLKQQGTMPPERSGRPSSPKPLPPTPSAHKPSRGRLWIGLLALFLVAAVVWWTHGRSAQQAQTGRPAATAALPVAAAAAETGDIPITYDALGTVTALRTVTVQAQVAGPLTQVAFQEGQDIKQGDFLAEIDPRPYQAALDQAEATLQRDQATAEEARMDLQRYQKLATENSIARQQAEDQLYVVHQNESTVKLDQALVDTAKLNLGYTHIVAPVSGRIGLRLVDPGNYVQIGNATASATGSSIGTATGIAVITQMQPISVLFTLPEDELPAVMKRLRSGAKLSVTAYDRGGDTKLGDGTLSAVDSQIDTATGTVKLRAEFANSDEMLFPNQFVNVELLIDTLKETVVIPSAGVQRGQPGTFVFVVQPDNTVSLRTIELGPQDGERVAVLSGLTPGEKIVIDGADKLRNGASIVLRPESGSGKKSSNGTTGGTDQTQQSPSDSQPLTDPQPQKKREHKHAQDSAQAPAQPSTQGEASH